LPRIVPSVWNGSLPFGGEGTEPSPTTFPYPDPVARRWPPTALHEKTNEA